MQQEDLGILTVLQKKYLLMLLTQAAFAITATFLLKGLMLWASYGVLGVVGLMTFGLYRNFYWQRLYKKLRPFIVARVLQGISCAGLVLLIALTFGQAQASKAWIHYGILWGLGCVIVIECFSIFGVAKDAKKKHPDRCEFC